MLNICLVAPLPPPYGGIAHWTGLITRYAKTRPEVDIRVINTAPRWRSIHQLSVVRRAVGGLVQMARDLFVLFFAARSRQVDVIHLTTSGQLAVFRDVCVLALSRALNVPLVYHIRFGRVPQVLEGATLEGKLIGRVIRSADVVLAIDETTALAVRHSLSEANVVVVPNCVDYSVLPDVCERETSTRVALFVGWVIPTKGISELLSAWSSIDTSGWVLRLVGPVDSGYIQELRAAFPLAGIEFLGELAHDDAMIEMARCDLFVLPSYTEGFPNAVVEAMALGKPVIATRVGAIPEMLEHGACGVLIESKDVNALIEAFQAVLGDDEARCLFGRKAAVRARAEYSIDTVFDRYLSIWGSVANRTASK